MIKHKINLINRMMINGMIKYKINMIKHVKMNMIKIKFFLYQQISFYFFWMKIVYLSVPKPFFTPLWVKTFFSELSNHGVCLFVIYSVCPSLQRKKKDMFFGRSAGKAQN